MNYTIQRATEVLSAIAEDMEKDAKDFDGKSFDGKTVGEYLGYQGAAIAALSNILSQHLMGVIDE